MTNRKEEHKEASFYLYRVLISPQKAMVFELSRTTMATKLSLLVVNAVAYLGLKFETSG